MKIESENVWQSWPYLKKLKFIILSRLFKKEKEQ